MSGSASLVNAAAAIVNHRFGYDCKARYAASVALRIRNESVQRGRRSTTVVDSRPLYAYIGVERK